MQIELIGDMPLAYPLACGEFGHRRILCNIQNFLSAYLLTKNLWKCYKEGFTAALLFRVIFQKFKSAHIIKEQINIHENINIKNFQKSYLGLEWIFVVKISFYIILCWFY